jgi:hypothetical protein
LDVECVGDVWVLMDLEITALNPKHDKYFKKPANRKTFHLYDNNFTTKEYENGKFK